MIFNTTTFQNTLEAAVSRYLNRNWSIRHIKDLADLACHPCALLTDGEFPIFAKYSPAADAARQFEIEADSLRFLSDQTGVKTPIVIGILPLETGAAFLMEALEEIERGPLQWRQIGQSLAQIHRVKADQFGFARSNFIGPLNQDNTPSSRWCDFYGERRLVPRLKEAVDSGNLPSEIAARVEKLLRHLPKICGPEPIPTLLHGDAQANNYISTRSGAVVIDPAIYYGHPELDLATLAAWQPVPEDVFLAYREVQPIDAGFSERCDLWRIALYLAAVNIEGPVHLPRLVGALRRYE